MDAGLTLLLLVLGAVAFVWFIRRSSESRVERPHELTAPSELATAADEPHASADRVLITHPVIRRAIERAQTRGTAAAQYIVREGDRLYLSFDRIEDAATRQRALEIVRRVEAGEDGSVTDIMWLVRRVFKQ